MQCVVSAPFLTVMSYRTHTFFEIGNDNLQVTVILTKSNKPENKWYIIFQSQLFFC